TTARRCNAGLTISSPGEIPGVSSGGPRPTLGSVQPHIPAGSHPYAPRSEYRFGRQTAVAVALACRAILGPMKLHATIVISYRADSFGDAGAALDDLLMVVSSIPVSEGRGRARRGGDPRHRPPRATYAIPRRPVLAGEDTRTGAVRWSFRRPACRLRRSASESMPRRTRAGSAPRRLRCRVVA